MCCSALRSIYWVEGLAGDEVGGGWRRGVGVCTNIVVHILNPDINTRGDRVAEQANQALTHARPP